MWLFYSGILITRICLPPEVSLSCVYSCLSLKVRLTRKFHKLNIFLSPLRFELSRLDCIISCRSLKLLTWIVFYTTNYYTIGKYKLPSISIFSFHSTLTLRFEIVWGVIQQHNNLTYVSIYFLCKLL